MDFLLQEELCISLMLGYNMQRVCKVLYISVFFINFVNFLVTFEMVLDKENLLEKEAPYSI